MNVVACSARNGVKNRNSRLLGHVNFDGQNYRFVRKGSKNGFISGFRHYFSAFGFWMYEFCVGVAVRLLCIIPDGYGVAFSRKKID